MPVKRQIISSSKIDDISIHLIEDNALHIGTKLMSVYVGLIQVGVVHKDSNDHFIFMKCNGLHAAQCNKFEKVEELFKHVKRLLLSTPIAG